MKENLYYDWIEIRNVMFKSKIDHQLQLQLPSNDGSLGDLKKKMRKYRAPRQALGGWSHPVGLALSCSTRCASESESNANLHTTHLFPFFLFLVNRRKDRS